MVHIAACIWFYWKFLTNDWIRPQASTDSVPHLAARSKARFRTQAAAAGFHAWVDDDHESKNTSFSRTRVRRQRGGSCTSSFFTLTQLYQGQSLLGKARARGFFLGATQQQPWPIASPTVSCVAQFNNKKKKRNSIEIWWPLIAHSRSLLCDWWETKDYRECAHMRLTHSNNLVKLIKVSLDRMAFSRKYMYSMWEILVWTRNKEETLLPLIPVIVIGHVAVRTSVLKNCGYVLFVWWREDKKA